MFEDKKASCKSALKQFKFISIYALKESKSSSFADYSSVFKWVKHLVRNVISVGLELMFFFLNALILNDCG